MTPDEELQRLRDDPEASPELRLGLERLSTRLPDPARLARIAAAVGAGDTIRGEPAPKPHAGTASAAKLGIIAGIAGAGGLAIWLLARPPLPRAVSPSPVLAPATAAAERPGGTVPEPVFNEPATGAPARTASAAASMGTLPSAPSAAEPAAPPTATPSAPVIDLSRPNDEADGRVPVPEHREQGKASSNPSSRTAPRLPGPSLRAAPDSSPPVPGLTETQILRDARLVLDRDPRSALALSEQHRRDYPNGAFVQERELIAITALARIGRTSEAAARAERFRKAYPGSPYRAGVDRIVPP